MSCRGTARRVSTGTRCCSSVRFHRRDGAQVASAGRGTVLPRGTTSARPCSRRWCSSSRPCLADRPAAGVLRITHIFRVVKRAKSLKPLLPTLVFSLPALYNMSILLLMLFFVYAVEVQKRSAAGSGRLRDSRSHWHAQMASDLAESKQRTLDLRERNCLLKERGDCTAPARTASPPPPCPGTTPPRAPAAGARPWGRRTAAPPSSSSRGCAASPAPPSRTPRGPAARSPGCCTNDRFRHSR